MATSTLLPNSTIGAGGWTRTGGSTIDGVLTDANDATYMTNSTGADASCGLGDLTGVVNLAGIQSVTVIARGRGIAAGSPTVTAPVTISLRNQYTHVDITDNLSTTPANVTGGTLGQPGTTSAPSATDLNGMSLVLGFAGQVGIYGPTADPGIRVIEASVTVTYDPMPIATLHPGF